MAKVRTRTKPFDIAAHLDNEATVTGYVAEAFSSGDAATVAAALGDVARARGMAKVAAETGLSREALYRTLSVGGNPELATLLKITAALGLAMTVQPAT